MRNKKILGVLGLSAVALVGGTFAYFTQTAQIDNPFNTAKYSTVVTEDFDPSKGENWQPGAEVEKMVNVHNFGNRPVVVKVEFEDHWARENSDWVQDVTDEHVFDYLQARGEAGKTDGLTEGDYSVVEKFFDENNITNWTKIGNAYYYNTVLAGTQNEDEAVSTGNLLTKVKLINDVDMGKEEKYLYSTTADQAPAVTPSMSGWGEPQLMDGNTATPANAKHTAIVTKPASNALGYSGANYKLTIKVTTVQATDKAVEAAFGEAVKNQMNWQLDSEAVN